MARYHEPTSEQINAWNAWVKERPPHVREVAERFDPWTLYRMTSTGQRVFVTAFDETDNGVMLRVGVSGEFNFLTHERQVFGIDPNDLVECDLPSVNELTGNLDMPIEVLREIISERNQ